MILEEHQSNLMRYIDREMDENERKAFEKHIETCETCKQLLSDFSMVKEVTGSMKIADLPEAVWDKYWEKIYNRIERSVAWFLFITGALILNGYWIYRAITDPGLYTLVGLGTVLTIVGFLILFLSVLREKLTVNKSDRYISEVKR
ncbi:MAG: zf-HC2 domain-containing protein [Candidatus Latescibacteria bacterium]|nr:zf-HC2 domain-containing protein [Candidatus Latescibacterota bacterium]